MKPLFLAISILLAGCTSQPVAQPQMPSYSSFTDLNSRQDFYRRIMAGSPDYSWFETAPPAFQTCMLAGTEDMMPAEFNAEVDRFLANKTQQAWDKLMEANNRLVVPNAGNQMVALAQDCKAKYGT